MPEGDLPPDPNEDEVTRIITYLCKRAFRDVREAVGLIPVSVSMQISYPRPEMGENIAHTVVMQVQVDDDQYEESFQAYEKRKVLKDALKAANGEESEKEEDELP